MPATNLIAYYGYVGDSTEQVSSGRYSIAGLAAKKLRYPDRQYTTVPRVPSNSQLTKDWLEHIVAILSGIEGKNHSDRWEKEHSHDNLFHPQTVGSKITEAKRRTRDAHLRHLIFGFVERCVTKFSDSTVVGAVGVYTTKEKIDELVAKLEIEMQISTIEWWHQHDVTTFNSAIRDKRLYWSKRGNKSIRPDYNQGVIFISPTDADFKLLEVGYNKMRGATV